MAKTLKLITLELYEKLAAKISDRIKNIELTPGPKGDTGPQGPTGAKGNTGDRGPQGYTFTPKVDASGNLSWTNNGGLDNPSTVNIKGPQGEKGATGDRGPQGPKGDNGYDGSPGRNGIDAGFGTVTAKMGNTLTGTPSVSVSTSGDSSAKNFEFTFSNLKGATGAQGATGPQGPTGPKGDKGDTGPQGPGGRGAATKVVGTTQSGHTTADCDYLCDGTADQVEINNAINALPSGGGKVILLEGTYNYTSVIGITKNNVSIEGMGPSTILRGNSIFCQVVGCDNFSMSNLSAECSAEQPFETFFHTVLLSNHIYTKGHYFRNLVIKNFKIGLHLYASDHNTIENCMIENCNTGIDVEYTSETRVLNNYIYNSDIGILIHNASHRNQISNNYIIRGTGTAGDYTTSQNTIQMSGGNYNDISNNYILGKNYVNSAGATNTFTNNRYQ